MLKSYENRRAYSESRLAFTMGPNEPIHTFSGKTLGKIAETTQNPEGTWTSIFQPDGYDKTYDQLDLQSKSLTSERKPSVEQFKKFILDNNFVKQ